MLFSPGCPGRHPLASIVATMKLLGWVYARNSVAYSRHNTLGAFISIEEIGGKYDENQIFLICVSIGGEHGPRGSLRRRQGAYLRAAALFRRPASGRLAAAVPARCDLQASYARNGSIVSVELD